ncbi:MAG TPA: LytTR family DNA-binding domain-containing protein [Bacteroidota bacterium]
MTILIIEDEQPAAEKLMRGIKQIVPAAELTGPVRSVKEMNKWLDSHPQPELIIADIQLTDGLSLEVFAARPLSCPVIFATAYDEYLLEALEHNSIDYLLKPIRQEKLERALGKYARLRDHFTSNIGGFLREFFEKKPSSGRKRIVVKKGIDFISVPVEDVAFFHTEHKVVFLVEKNGTRYIVDTSLSDLEEDLDKAMFFRANRKFIVNIASVGKFKSLDKGKLALETTPRSSEPIIVSQENAAEFKKWMGK